jgi:putative FmdB family regulatory protein
MARYEYLCLTCERPFEDRRPMTADVMTAVACPSCGSERVRRRFSFVASKPGGADPSASAGCGCGGGCGC